MKTAGRLQTGLIIGGIGAIGLLVSSLTGAFWVIFSFFGGAILAGFTGYFAGRRAGSNPAFAGRAVSAGALAGTIAGAVLLVGQIISGIIAANQPGTLSQFQQLNSQPTSSPIDAANIALAFGFIGGCFGLLDIGLAASMGAAGGALTGRSNRLDPAPTVPDLPPLEYPPAARSNLGPNIIQPPPSYPDEPRQR